MKISIRSAVFAGALLLLLSTSAMAQSTERDAVDQVMQKMMRAFETGDANLAFEVLRRDGMVLGYSASRGAVVAQTTEEWAKGFQGKPADDEAQRTRSYEIVDVNENAAVVKVMLDYPKWIGLDYLALSKIDGKWMIVSKSWSGQTKP
ncbi:nuclear transport factor 2 family protein [Montanilutibacter psychrotolerans]|uniref:Nuclear transport factor 2 family protein n=1 Tax=Montanilutibacter psychrotolerans TaxID=1327343 RepID=A0A3M8SY98_9GAMM|nr:nuclear transport factor 2 family protein [Lysobacter psychrotolerans]RNF86219.1 nuclear transport factor 2 family protein [Lysobacter psychrotolerans]